MDPLSRSASYVSSAWRKASTRPSCLTTRSKRRSTLRSVGCPPSVYGMASISVCRSSNTQNHSCGRLVARKSARTLRCLRRSLHAGLNFGRSSAWASKIHTRILIVHVLITIYPSYKNDLIFSYRWLTLLRLGNVFMLCSAWTGMLPWIHDHANGIHCALAGPTFTSRS